jgi:hypothetical protein
MAGPRPEDFEDIDDFDVYEYQGRTFFIPLDPRAEFGWQEHPPGIGRGHSWGHPWKIDRSRLPDIRRHGHLVRKGSRNGVRNMGRGLRNPDPGSLIRQAMSELTPGHQIREAFRELGEEQW